MVDFNPNSSSTGGSVHAGQIVTFDAVPSDTPRAASSDPSADSPAGGGESYDDAVSREDADTVVESREELLDALDSTDSDETTVIYVSDTAHIDLSGRRITIPGDTTLASGRGQNRSRGALLSCDERTSRLFIIEDVGVRITGLRLRGPESEYIDPDGDVWDHNSLAIRAYADCEVDNCELYNWTHAAIGIGEDGEDLSTSDAHIHHCSIHHNRMDGLGYGIVVYRGNPVIEHSFFDYNRHSIAADGAPGCSYEARFNYQGPHNRTFGFEMHAPGGDQVDIHHNTFEPGRSERAVAIRGVPDDGGSIQRNWFTSGEAPGDQRYSDTSPIVQYDTGTDSDSWVNVDVSENHFGEDEPDSDIGHPRGEDDTTDSSDGQDQNQGQTQDQPQAATPSEELAHTIVIEGNDETTANYEFSVTGQIEKTEADGATINEFDTIDAASVTGRTTSEPDAFTYSGEVTGFDADAPVTVSINGTPVSPDATDDPDIVLTIEGQGETAHYELTIDGEVRKSDAQGGTLNDYDSISDGTVTGRTTREPDTYAIMGTIEDFEADAPVTTLRNGEVVDPESLTPDEEQTDGDEGGPEDEEQDQDQEQEEPQPDPEDTPEENLPDETDDPARMVERAIHDETNAYREEQGGDPLEYSDSLADVARAHSADMNDRYYVSHTNPDGEDVGDRLEEAGIDASEWAENLAYQTYQDVTTENAADIAQSITEGWINSEGHRENILGEYDEEGVGIDVSNRTVMATQVFRTSDSS